MTAPIATYDKDPDATLDYSIDWSPWLPSGDAIDSATWTSSDAALVMLSDAPHAPSVVAGIATVWISGGVAGTRYRLTCQVETTAGRVDERTIVIAVADR